MSRVSYNQELAQKILDVLIENHKNGGTGLRFGGLTDRVPGYSKECMIETLQGLKYREFLSSRSQGRVNYEFYHLSKKAQKNINRLDITKPLSAMFRGCKVYHDLGLANNPKRLAEIPFGVMGEEMN